MPTGTSRQPGSAFGSDRSPLSFGDAVAAIITVDEGRFLLQLRDDKPGIWYPGFWGCFGGGVEPGEDPVDAIRRELVEELGIEVGSVEPSVGFTFAVPSLGDRAFYRRYFRVALTNRQLGEVSLGEGAAVEAFAPELALGGLPLVPYDAFALFLYWRENRLR